jgi:ribosome-associated protein
MKGSDMQASKDISRDNSGKLREEMLEIPEREISFSYSKSSGPGGQNVNKRASKVRLQFDVLKSNVLSFDEKNAILRHPKLSHLLSNNGVISITSQKFSSQLENKKAVIKSLHELLSEALRPEKERVPGGRPPNANFEPSEHRKRELRRSEQKLRADLKWITDMD